MTVRLNSDSKDDQIDTIRQFLEVAKEGAKEEEENLEAEEVQEEELEVTTQKVGEMKWAGSGGKVKE